MAGSFNNTSATYKFYWFIALLDESEHGHTRINKQHLFTQMIANAWYTVNYFHVSFGTQDQLQRAIEDIKISEGISIDEKKSVIVFEYNLIVLDYKKPLFRYSNCDHYECCFLLNFMLVNLYIISLNK